MADFLSFDVEDDGGKFLCCSFAWGPNLEDSSCFDDPVVVASTLENTTKSLVAHNGGYDLKVLRPLMHYYPFIEIDTWIAAMFLYPDKRFTAGELTLKNLAPKLLGVDPWGSAQDLIQKYGSMSAVPQDELFGYCQLDSVYTWRLLNLFLPDLRKKNLLNTVRLESNVIAPGLQMQDNGVLIDRVTLNGMTDKLDDDIRSVKAETLKVAPRVFSIATPADVSSILFSSPPTGIGLNPGNIKKNKSGFYSTAADGLENLESNPLKDGILQWRSLSSLRTRFIAQMRHAIQLNNRVYTNWNLLGTITGRMTSNLQQIPAKEKTGKHVRGIIVAPPAYRIVACDFSQIQLRILAGLADCKNMIAIFASGGDIHNATVQRIPLLAELALTNPDDARKLAKAVNFGLVFGMSPGGLCHYGLTYPQALQFYREYFQEFPEIKEYHEKLLKFSHHGYVVSYCGRRIPCQPGSNSVKCLPVQATEADIVKIAMVRMEKALRKLGRAELLDSFRLVLQVHDELVYEVHENEVDMFCRLLKEQFESIEFPVQMKIDIEVGRNWLETTKWEAK